MNHGNPSTGAGGDSTHKSDADASSNPGDDGPAAGGSRDVGRILVVSTVMLAFISYRRTAAVVLCDLASTAFYIGGIVEAQVGKAAPWFILGVMLFSYAVRSVYIESCTMFVRGGVYRVVKQAMGGIPAKLSVSALLFDYVLTGPISGVSAGQYLLGLANEGLRYLGLKHTLPVNQGAAVIAGLTTFYFWRSNVRGLRESTGKALKIMTATTVMAGVMLVWCGITLAVRPETRHIPPATPNLTKKVDADGKPAINEITGRQEDPLGWLGETSVAESLREPKSFHWTSLIGVFGILIAFGHSVLAMSGEETLAQVYREVESPKLANFKKAAFIVFLYSLVLTALISFFAVMIIPDKERIGAFQDNLIGGLAMSVVGPHWARLLLHGFVVIVGFLVLSGAVNTAIVGSNGVLQRVAEDGVLPDWLLKPHPKYGTSSRVLNLIFGLQLFTIFVSGGNVLVLGEAYAFGVIWSFVFMTASMLVLRFRRPGERAFMVPGNIKVGQVEVPIGLSLIFLVLISAAIVNLFTKPVATISGGVFSATLFALFVGMERYVNSKEDRPKSGDDHPEKFQVESVDQFSVDSLHLSKPDRVLVGIRSKESLDMLKTYLGEVDPEKTDVVVVAADVIRRREPLPAQEMSKEDQTLLTSVVHMAELVGKPVIPLVVPTDDPFSALARIARAINARELVLGPSRRQSTDQLFDKVAHPWEAGGGEGKPTSITIRVLGDGRDVTRKLG